MMIGDRQMWRQYDLNIHRDLILMSRGVFKVDQLKLDAAAVFACHLPWTVQAFFST